MPSYESSMRNLEKARAVGRPLRASRSNQESRMIRRLAFQWFTGGSKPSGRAWARALGISHTWPQKLVREFTADPSKMWRLQAAKGDPQFKDLMRGREYSWQMGERGELRRGLHLSRGQNWRSSWSVTECLSSACHFSGAKDRIRSISNLPLAPQPVTPCGIAGRSLS
jgi:hypothetical protein